MKMFYGFLLLPSILFAQKTIGFRVNVTSASVVATQVGIRGGTYPLSWSKSVMLDDKDGDGIFSGEIAFPSNDIGLVEYKYIINEKDWELNGENRIWITNLPSNRIDNWNKNGDISPDMLPLITAEALQSDLAILRQAITLHPGLMRYLTTADTANLFNDALQQFNRPHTYREAFLAFSKLAATIRCGHTYANYFNQNGLTKHVLFNQADKLPFLFTWVEKRMIITDPISSAWGLQRGDEVISMNGQSVAVILETLLPYIKADGYNDAKRISSLQVTGAGKYESFDIFFPLLFPPSNNMYQVEVQTAAGLKTLTVPAMTANERNAKRMKPAPPANNSNPLGWQYQLLNDSVALLSLPTFSIFNSNFNWEKYLQETFNDIRQKEIKHLLIDIRGNEGGDDGIAYAIAKELAVKPIKGEPKTEKIAYEKIPENLLPFCASWDDRFKDFSGKVRMLPEGMFTWKNEPKPLYIPKNAKAYSGDIYLLTDAANSSATYYMARLMRYNQMGKLAGETTGGDMQGINGGQIIFLRLPNTGIEIDIPVYGTYYTTTQSGGIVPDIPVKTTVADIKNGTDPVIKKLMEIFK